MQRKISITLADFAAALLIATAIMRLARAAGSVLGRLGWWRLIR